MGIRTHQTLQIDFTQLKPPITVAGIAFIIILIFSVAVELLARTSYARQHLAPASIGTPHEDLGPRLAQLDAYVAREGHVDCILVGSSMVGWGIDPTFLSDGVEQITGRPLICYNFAVNGFAAYEEGLWAQVMAERYQPDLLILGQSARDYSYMSGGKAVGIPLEVPWTRYQLGEFSLEGWLTDHSRAYSYYMTYRIWPAPDYHDRIARQVSMAEQLTPLGYYRHEDVYNVSQPPDQESPLNTMIVQALANYAISDIQVAGLERFAALQNEGVELVLVEMPLPDTYYAFFGNGKNSYQDYEVFITAYLQAGDITYISIDETLPPLSDTTAWADYGHLSQDGAAIFSHWLGTQIGLAAQNGQIDLPDDN